MTEISNQSDPKRNHAQVFDDVLEDSEDEHGEEAEDSFPVDNMISTVSDGHQFLFDMGTLSLVSDRDRRETGSIAATDLASSMGSVMLRYHDAFLKDIVFFKDMSRGWSIKFEKSTVQEKRSRYAKPRLVIQSLGGVFSCSRLKIGDCFESINGEKVNESTLDPDLVMDHLSECLNEDGFLSVATADKEFGDEVLIQSTIIKPRPDMTCEEMGTCTYGNSEFQLNYSIMFVSHDHMLLSRYESLVLGDSLCS